MRGLDADESVVKTVAVECLVFTVVDIDKNDINTKIACIKRSLAIA